MGDSPVADGSGEMKDINKNITIPNALSVFRIFLIPPFVLYFLGQQWKAAGVVLVVSGLTDLVDGYIARRFNQITELGKLLDPLADKLTQAAVAVCMAIVEPVLVPFLAVFVVKETVMIIAACVLLKRKKRPTAAKWYGKVATTMFYVSFAVIYVLKGFFDYENFYLTITLLSATVGMMVYAFLRYFGIFWTTLHSDDPKDTVDLELKARRTISRK